MSNDDDDLPFGLYERLVTAGLKARLLRFDSASVRIVTEELDAAEAHATLARHIANLAAGVLRALPQENLTAAQTELTNQIIRLLAANPIEAPRNDELVETPPEQLRAIQPIGNLPTENRELVAPLVALSASDLLVNARGEPGLAHALAHEIPSADSIDLLCAFVRWHGLRLLEDQIEAHCQAGRRLRVITTVFTGSTERKAVDWLVSRGAQVKVSYDTQSTRLHAKAWLFRRASGYSTAYIGSSNLSKAALVDGVEWNVRLSQVGSPDILEKFDATFDTYWENPEYESYEPNRDAARFDRAVAPQQGELLRHRSSSWMSNRGRTSGKCSRSSPSNANGITASRISSSPPPEQARRSLRHWTTNVCATSTAICACCLSHIGTRFSGRVSGHFVRFCGRETSASCTWTVTGPTSGGTCLRPFSRSHRSIWSTSIPPRSTS